jgi:hypothetical protein
MKALEVALSRAVVGLAAGLLLNCGGGGYGGGDGGGNPRASLDISVEPDTITLGESATLTWNSNAGSCQASGAWDGSQASSGSLTVTPDATGEFTYSLVCGGGGYRESETGSATLTVNAAAVAGAFVGEACCAGSGSFEVAGLTSANGKQRVLSPGAHWVGEAGKDPIAYATCENCLAGARLDKAPEFRLMRIAPPAAGPLDAVDGVQGNFTTFLANGYTLAISIDAMGRLSGADTNGCSLRGQAVKSRTANLFDVRLDITSCGARDGRYLGEAALLPASGDRAAELMLSTSNADAAIGWRLGAGT